MKLNTRNRIVVLVGDELLAAIDRHTSRRMQSVSGWTRGLIADALAREEQQTPPVRERQEEHAA